MTNRRAGTITPGYMSGFGNSFETEALPGALPVGRNSPQRCAYGLYAEQLSGSPSPRRAAPTSARGSIASARRCGIPAASRKVDAGLWRTAPCHEVEMPIGQLRWDPVPMPANRLTFLEGLRTMTTAGDADTQAGMAAHVYLITRSMPTSTSTMPTARC